MKTSLKSNKIHKSAYTRANTDSLFFSSHKITMRSSGKRSTHYLQTTNSTNFYGFKFKFNDEIEGFDFSTFNSYENGGFLKEGDIENCKHTLKKALGAKLYSKAFHTSILTYCSVFSVVIILAGITGFYFLTSVEFDEDDESKNRELAILWSIASIMIFLILGCVISSVFYTRTETLAKKRWKIIQKVEGKLNKESVQQKKNIAYKFLKEGDTLVIYPRDIELLENKLLTLDRTNRTTNPNSKREVSKDLTLSLDFEKNTSNKRKRSDSFNYNFYGIDDLSSIYDIGEIEVN